MKKHLSFSEVKFDELNQIVRLMGIPDFYDTRFQEWFSYPYTLNDTELQWLKRLLSQHKLYVSTFGRRIKSEVNYPHS